MNNLLKKAAIAAFALIGTGIVAVPAHAQLTQFASFSGLSQNNFRYNSATNTLFSTFDGTNPGGIPVNFFYRQNTAAGLAFTNIAATLSFAATGVANVDGNSDLPVTNVSMTITANTAPNAILGTNLLTINSGATALIDGTLGGAQGSINSDTSQGNTLVYSSSYLTFGASSQRVLGFTTTNLTPSYGVTANRPNTFLGSFDGNFSSNPAPTSVTVVPEANAGLLAGLALPLLGGVAVLRRRK